MDNFDYDVVVWWRSSGLYLCYFRYQLKTVLLDKNPTAGALAITHKIANYPVYLARSVEVNCWTGCVNRRLTLDVSTSGPRFSDRCRRYSEKSLYPRGTFTGRALVLASGAMGRASISGEAEFLGRGSELLRYLRCSCNRGWSLLASATEAIEGSSAYQVCFNRPLGDS